MDRFDTRLEAIAEGRWSRAAQPDGRASRLLDASA